MKEQLEIVPTQPQPIARPEPSTIDILNAAVSGGVTAENVAVVEKLIALRREEQAFGNKLAFNKAFFALRKEIQTLDIYADKAAKTESGNPAYTYASEKEIAEKLEPVLFRHGFAMMFSQRQDGERTVAIITLVHEQGHEEVKEYAVRSGGTNRMKDATAADTGATTSAWRHLCIKLFGLKSRISEASDPRNDGGLLDKKKRDELEHRAKMVNRESTILEMAGVKSFSEIRAGIYDVLDNALRMIERKGAK